MQLAVIAKEPVPGRVKTRLSPAFTPSEAASLAAAALDDTLRAVASVPVRRRVLVLEGVAGPWVPPGFDVVAQHGDGLAARLANAFVDCTATGDEPVVLIGMDTPQVTPGQLADAAARLAGPRRWQERRAVLGPSTDGGYWLIGLNRADPQAFEGVEMSSSKTFRQQIAALRSSGYDIDLVDELTDVDHADDVTAVARQIPGSAFARRLETVRPPVAA